MLRNSSCRSHGEFHFWQKDKVALGKHQPRRARGAIKGMMMQERIGLSCRLVEEVGQTLAGKRP